MKKIVILGAGVAGLTCAHLLKNDFEVVVLEKDSNIGGLCQSFEIDGFWFDYGAHAAFTKNEEVRYLLEDNLKLEKKLVSTMNYKEGKWIKNPVQNNLYVLDTDEKIRIIKDFVECGNNENTENYGEWLEVNYGKYFAHNYPYLYTRKYWTVEPSQMETKWVGIRMYRPTLEEVLYGSYSDNTPEVHYAGEIRYPITGGYGRYLEKISENLNIICGAQIVNINTKEKYIIYNNQKLEYDELISTIPLTEIVELMEDIPDEVRDAAKGLDYTTLTLVSLGIRKKDVVPNGAQAFYVYDQDILASRVYSTSQYGKDNAPEGCTSLQAEIYSSKYKSLDFSQEEIKKKVIDDFIEMGLFEEEDVIVSDVRQKKYANIIFTKDIYKNRDIIHDFLDKEKIIYAGRFGEWDYLWSDQSVISGKRVAEKILE